MLNISLCFSDRRHGWGRASSNCSRTRSRCALSCWAGSSPCWWVHITSGLFMLSVISEMRLLVHKWKKYCAKFHFHSSDYSWQ